jgi:AcrR family transcriptional regulator
MFSNMRHMTGTSTATSTRVRMTPEGRREQLLDLGVRLLSTRSLEQVSIEVLSEEAGISRGLLYHYFGSKEDFHRAVVRRAADDLIAVTAPGQGDDLSAVLTDSLGAYVDYVVANRPGYLSLVRAAGRGQRGAPRDLRGGARLADRPDVRASGGARHLRARLRGHPGRAADGARLERALRSRWCSTGRPTSTE